MFADATVITISTTAFAALLLIGVTLGGATIAIAVVALSHSRRSAEAHERIATATELKMHRES